MPLIVDHNGKTVRIARAVRNLTQMELGRACGLPSWRIWKIENGEAQATAEEWAKIWGVLSSE